MLLPLRVLLLLSAVEFPSPADFPFTQNLPAPNTCHLSPPSGLRKSLGLGTGAAVSGVVVVPVCPWSGCSLQPGLPAEVGKQRRGRQWCLGPQAQAVPSYTQPAAPWPAIGEKELLGGNAGVGWGGGDRSTHHPYGCLHSAQQDGNGHRSCSKVPRPGKSQLQVLAEWTRLPFHIYWPLWEGGETLASGLFARQCTIMVSESVTGTEESCRPSRLTGVQPLLPQ